MVVDGDEDGETEARCRAALSAEAFARAWDEGAALDTVSAADWALRLSDDTQVS